MLKVDAPDPNPTGHAGASIRACPLAKGTKEVNLDHGKLACATGLYVAHMSLCGLRCPRPKAKFRLETNAPSGDIQIARGDITL